MKTTLLALPLAALVGTTFAAAVPAHALPVGADLYVMTDIRPDNPPLGCAFVAVNDPTPDGTLGARNQWNGIITMAFTATGKAECELFVNGNSLGIVSVSVSSVQGVIVNAAQFSVTADRTDVVTLCDVVNGVTVKCDDATVTKVVPQPVDDLVDSLIRNVDPTLCPLIGLLAPGIPGVVDVDPSGDVAVFNDAVWDCPPYDL